MLKWLKRIFRIDRDTVQIEAAVYRNIKDIDTLKEKVDELEKLIYSSRAKNVQSMDLIKKKKWLQGYPDDK